MMPASGSSSRLRGEARDVGRGVAVLVDFDNVFVGAIDSPEQVAAAIDRLVRLAISRASHADHVEIRLYGGWLDEGLYTRRASELQSAMSGTPKFPMRHPARSSILRGDVQLVTRLAAVPDLEWGHTLRQRSGLPRVRLADQPYPNACVHQSSACPVRALLKFAGRPGRECSAAGCGVTNRAAFRVPEQKMVDVLLSCDTIAYSRAAWNVMVISSDLDVLPAVVMSATEFSGPVSLVRSVAKSADLYVDELSTLGVSVLDWDSS